MELVNRMNDKKNDKKRTLFALMEYFCDHVDELTHDHYRIVQKIAHFVLSLDDTLSDRFDIYFDKLKPICKDIDSIECEVPYGYSIQPVKDFQIKKLDGYISYVLMKRWKNISFDTDKDFDMFFELLTFGAQC